MRRTCIVVLAGVLLGAPAFGHGDLHERIEELSGRIARDPADASLLRRRGELYRQHGNYVLALADVERAWTLDDSWAAYDHVRARILLDAGWAPAACAILDRYCAAQPESVPGRLTRARARAASGRGDATEDYAFVAARTEDVTPDFYVEWAAASDADGAIDVIESGMARLGPLVSLVERAIELDVASGRYDSALRRIEDHAVLRARADLRHARRGSILEAAGRRAEAMEACREALDSMASLPERTARLEATEETRREVTARLRRLSEAGE